VPWNPRDPQEPRFLLVTDSSTGAIALRPVFVGSLVAKQSPLWPQSIWLLPAGTPLSPGSFVFTTDALLAGMVVADGHQLALVPGAVVLAEAERLSKQPPGMSVDLGVEVQELTGPIAKATGASTGVVVTQVDPNGPSANTLAVGDVLEAINDMPLESPLHWKARAFGLSADKSVRIRVRRAGEVHELELTAAAPRQRNGVALGMQLRNAPGLGSTIAQVESGSMADRAGLRTGDIITLIGNTKTPSPAAVMRAVQNGSDGEAVLVGFVRNGAHAVTALER
jgi:S1-C subfamily serine protease